MQTKRYIIYDEYVYMQGYINNTRVDNLNKIVDDIEMSNAQWQYKI